ncbi:hypothetical protein BX600DRAFT_506839 [Xylariales sp. PMI_506]|nr:hypothetical protein BX600DRAFT_506839 [Xylariales sp. PMI_506]
MAEQDTVVANAAADASPTTVITLRAPSKYSASSAQPSTTTGTPFVAPSLDWLARTWSVTHSTLSMWRSARNVRITYSPLANPEVDGIDDLVEYEKKSSLKSVQGIDKPDPSTPGAWNWRGKGWLKIASSHWEILGWGERPRLSGEGANGDTEVESWVVTWFAPTLFTKEGVDIYSDRREGLSKATLDEIMRALKNLNTPGLVAMIEKDMLEVEVTLPWKEKV